MNTRTLWARGVLGSVALMSLLASSTQAVDTRDTQFLHEPAISADRIVFVYAGDLWTARHDGSEVRRLTAHPGPESAPHISPDGSLVAFTATYDGNVDVYVVPITGGEPTRLTWHPGNDLVRGFTPDGKILFASQRSVFTARYNQFFTIDPKGGFPDRLNIPNGFRGELSPDGKYLAYTPLGEMFRQWKNYRGGTASRVWVIKLDDLSVDIIPQPEGRCNDTYPTWIGNTVYFLSDRDGEFNLYAMERGSKAVRALTHHDDFPIESASSGAGKIVYEQAGHVHLFDPNSGSDNKLKIGVAAELVETRPRFARGAKWLRNASLSPSGKRAAVEFRGEIVTLPAKKGDARNITRTTDANERSPAWSPDGKSIAYFSDATGEYTLNVRPHDGQAEAKVYALKGSGFYEKPSWSPDSKKVAFIDSGRAYHVLDIESGKVTKIAAEPIYGPVNTMATAWSPDSKWLAYTLTNKAMFQSLYLYAADNDKSTRLTDGLTEAGTPAFDKGGKYLYFLVSTDAGPVKQWFDQSNADMQATSSLYMVTLAKATANPLLKPNDDEGEDPKKDDAKDKEKDKDAKPKPTVVDLDGIDRRIQALPVAAGLFEIVKAGPEGTVYYTKRVGYVPGRAGDEFQGSPTLARFDLSKREEETLAEKVDGFEISGDNKSILYRSKEMLGIVDAGKFKTGDGSLAIDAISVKVDPRSEWRQIAREAWRINRDYFYATNMHGADWSAIWSKYEPLIAEVPCRDDLNRVIRDMCSELAVGHSYLRGGEFLYEPKSVPIGLLGADYEVDHGRYRFKKIYGGASWDPNLKAPLVAPGVEVKAGDYLLAVDGENLTSAEEIFRQFENKVGRRVTLKVGPNPDGEGSKTVTVEPVAEESALRNRDWVESNMRKVHEKTSGKVAYVYVPNTADLGHAYFKRYFFPQVDKQAIIVDERFNGGGSVADYYIDFLRRPVVSYWAMRHGEISRTPGAAILGPKVMLIDETAGSGGDLLPWMFRKFKLGTLVGRRTWGGLVGILGFPELMDGGTVTAPDLAFYTEDGWRVENEGVPPDIEVEQWPADVLAGKDPQLDKAIEVILKELQANPPKELPRPDFPVRVRKPKVAARE